MLLEISECTVPNFVKIRGILASEWLLILTKIRVKIRGIALYMKLIFKSEEVIQKCSVRTCRTFCVNTLVGQVKSSCVFPIHDFLRLLNKNFLPTLSLSSSTLAHCNNNRFARSSSILIRKTFFIVFFCSLPRGDDKIEWIESKNRSDPFKIKDEDYEQSERRIICLRNPNRAFEDNYFHLSYHI